MNKKLGRLLWPGLWAFFAVMVGFVIAAAVAGNFVLAIVEGGIAALLGIYYVNSKRKHLSAPIRACIVVPLCTVRSIYPSPSGSFTALYGPRAIL